ncbi:MAG: hybrid sensor histidine kinase/response regulator [Massilia sp.]|nr:hybrid sensor histidine kinase/response regulator [Massilia sp.]
MNNKHTPAAGMAMDLLVNAIRDYAIYMLGPDGTIISWNAGAERIKGYVADEIIGQHFSRFHTPDDQANEVPAHALRMARETGKFECEGWRVRKDGSRFWAHVVIDPVYTKEGEFVGFAKITRDITEKREASESLLASERQFRLLVQGVVDYAIYMLAPDGTVTNWNNGARRIKGYEAEEIIGRHFSQFYTEEDRHKELPARALALATENGRFESEAWRVRKDGTRFWAHVVIDAIWDHAGALIGFAKITRDITERKMATQALEQAQAQLFQSQKMEALGQLTGGVAHDFNNLLSIISSAVQILSRQQSTKLESNILDTIQRAVDRGASLTQQLLAFSRQQPLTPANHKLNKIIESFEPVLRRAVPSSVEFHMSLGRDPGWLNVDEARFEAALLNLVVNARDAMPDGGRLELTTSMLELAAGDIPELPAGQYVRTSVADSGHGMDQKTLSRVFEPFYTTKEVGKGTGLGLSQVHGFIVQSGGSVTIESAPAAGTTVHLILPALEGASDDRDSESGSETVIIAEDEEELASLAASLFQTLGFEVLVAHNGAEALRLLNQHPDTDLLFSDVMMPGMTGIELARAARSMYPALKIILASGYPGASMRTDGAIDEFAFVSKPYRLSEIVKRLR